MKSKPLASDPKYNTWVGSLKELYLVGIIFLSISCKIESRIRVFFKLRLEPKNILLIVWKGWLSNKNIVNFSLQNSVMLIK